MSCGSGSCPATAGEPRWPATPYLDPASGAPRNLLGTTDAAELPCPWGDWTLVILGQHPPMEREPQPAPAWLRDSAASQMQPFALGPGSLFEPGAVTMAGRSRRPGMETAVTTLRSSHIDRSENICPASLAVLVSAS